MGYFVAGIYLEERQNRRLLCWMRISQSLISPQPRNVSHQLSQNPAGVFTEKIDAPLKHYIPGAAHLTTILHVFSPLFERVKKKLPVDELRYERVPTILKGIIGVPISTEQAPFIMCTSAEITPTQESVLDCVRIMYLVSSVCFFLGGRGDIESVHLNLFMVYIYSLSIFVHLW
ncbi:unnamed protein product [Anisakis simplex]|uniref:Monensin-resistant homolog 2 (inferred by orthology to a C. elegans protein) n=1 Tax=Anisakis simplex TaxID=6269 RepID=A0A0M3J8Z3_ANISI|nr:unnamed protein product [Anisakis simplex]